MAGLMLEGDEAAPATLIELQPGQDAILRGVGHARLDGEAVLEERSLAIRAEFTLVVEPEHYAFPVVRSQNHRALTLLPR